MTLPATLPFLMLDMPPLFHNLSTELSRDLSGVVGSAKADKTETSPNSRRREYEADTGPDGDAPAAKRLNTGWATAWALPGPSGGSAPATGDVTDGGAHGEDLPSTGERGRAWFDESGNFDFVAWQRELLAPIVPTGSHSPTESLDPFEAPSNELPRDREERLRRLDALPALPKRDIVATVSETLAVDVVSDDDLFGVLSDLATDRNDSLKCTVINAQLRSANYVEARRLLDRLIDKLETSHGFTGNWLSAFEALHKWSVAFEVRTEQTLSAALLATGTACQKQVRNLAQLATCTRFDELTAFRLHAMADMPPPQQAAEWNGLLASLQRCRDAANAQTLGDLTKFIALLPVETRLPSARAILALGLTLPKHSAFKTDDLFSVLGDADKLSLADHCLEDAEISYLMEKLLRSVIDELPCFPAEDASRLMQRVADLAIGQIEESWELQLGYNARANLMRALTRASERDTRTYERPDFYEMKRAWHESVTENLGD